jgi:radical SAM protein with 4Fe4S-binding SPASM domain
VTRPPPDHETVFEHVTPPPRHRPPLADPAGPGVFFAQRAFLPAGRLVARYQVMLPEPLPLGAEIATTIGVPGGAEILARRFWRVDPAFAEGADDLMLELALEAPREVEVRCWAATAAGAFRLRAVTIKRAAADGTRPADWSTTHGALDRWPLDRLRSVMIGNSGVCTASCIHCPTNKPGTPAGSVMSDRVFARIVEGLAACGLPIVGAIGFGVYADPLTDRKLAQRIRLLKDALPGVPVTISTTGAAFVPRQEEAIALADSVGVHVESLDPATYDRLMAPLSLARVIPRVEALVRFAGKKAVLAIPVHRDNLDGIPALEAWWESLGGGRVELQPFTNRLSMAEAVTRLHLAPVGGACTQDLAYDLIIDWDGRLLSCCNDFHKRSDLGSVAERPLPELIADARRERFFQLLRSRHWQKIEVCRGCLFDDPMATRRAVEAERAKAREAAVAAK